MTPYRTLLAAATLVLLGACGGESNTDFLGSAKTYLAKNEPKSAVIQLKSALQKDPSSAEARFLLGKALLDTGDASAATIELNKALDLKYDEQAIIPELARALQMSGEFGKLSDRYGQKSLTDPKAQADLKTSLAIAYGALGRRDESAQAIAAALQAVPEHGPALKFQSRLKADAGDIEGALSGLDQLIARDGKDHEAWQVKAEILNFGKRDAVAALAAYQEAARIKPDFAPAHAGAITIQLGNRDLDAAKAQLALLQKALPNSPQTRYFEGNIALLGKDLDKARDIGNELLAVAPDNPRVLQLAGATAYERQEFPQAELHLARALQFEPRLDASRRLLALTYLRTSQPGRALTTLQPLLEVAEPSAQTYSLVAQAQLQAGDLAEAEANFAKAAKLNPKDTRSKAALAVSRLVQGDTGGVAELQSLAAADAGTAADLPLISALVRKKDFAGAMRAIDALEKKLQGPQPGVWNLRARVNLRQGDRASARKNLEKALEIRPDFYPAAAALAGLDLADKRVDDAKKRFDSVLAADPRNVQALLASAALKARTGAPRDDVLATFRDAIKQSPNAAAPRLALINYHFSLNETGAALSAAQQGAAAMPNHPEMVDALGRAQVATNDLNQALSTYNKLVQLQPGSAQALVRVAEVYARSGKRSEALSQLKRALAVDAEYLPAQLALSNAHLEDRKFDDALRIARDVQKQRPNQTIGWLTEGNIQAAQKRWDPALASYRAGLKLAPNSTELASRIHASLSAAGRRDEAEKWAEKWTSDHANDAAFRFYLGDVALVRNDRADAEAQYRHVLRLQPDNALALNNVAWLMAMNDKKGALELAERANKNLPNRPVIMDTLALALVREGQAPKAVEVLRQALSIEPDNAPLRLNLAKALIQINEKEAARGELKELIKLGSKFARQDEVRELLKSL